MLLLRRLLSGSRPIAVYLAAVLCALGTARCTREPAPSPPASQAAPEPAPSRTDDERPKIAVLGDSLTAGLGLLEAQSYPSLLQQKVNADGFSYEVVNAGVTVQARPSLPGPSAITRIGSASTLVS